MGAGNLAFGGVQRSYSFGFFHADRIPNSTTAVVCPNMACEQINIQNDPTSTGNITLGDEDTLPITGNGWVLQPGETTGWLPVENLNLIWHVDSDATSYLNYKMVRGGKAQV